MINDRRNNLLLVLLTVGEGWHNHHQCPSAVRQGFRWWEIDLTYYLLQGLQLCGLIWDIRPVPERVLNQPEQLSQDTHSEKIAI